MVEDGELRYSLGVAEEMEPCGPDGTGGGGGAVEDELLKEGNEASVVRSAKKGR